MSIDDPTFPGDVAWLTTGYPWPGDEVQGVFHQTAARALSARRVPIRVVAPVPLAPWPLPNLATRWASYAGTPASYRDGDVQVRRPRFVALPLLPSWSRPEQAMARAFRRAICSGERIALVHSHFAFPAAPAGSLVARELGRPHVVTVHGSDINTWPATHRRQVPLVIDVLRSADAFVAVSEALADRAEELCGRRPEVVPIGIDSAAFTANLPDRAGARGILGLDPGRFLALFVGRLSREKGAPRLVDAVLRAGAEITCLMVGDGPALGYRATEGRGRVRYLGVRRRSQVALLMRAADVVVLPSDAEGLPTVMVEAGAIGTFVIASPVGGIPELIGDHRGWLLDDATPEAIVSAFEATAADPDRTAASAAALRVHVEAHYDAHRNAGRLVDIYRRVLRDA